jgi:pimeloyl-ACP methyl ester carboxylesterase
MGIGPVRSKRNILPFIVLLLVAGTVRADAGPLEFHLTFDKSVSDKPFTGRVYVMLSKDDVRSLRPGPNWFRPEPFFALDVKDWKPSEVVVLGKEALGFPMTLDKLPSGTWSIQAVMDFNRGFSSFSSAEGNGYSEPLRRELNAAETGPVKLALNQVYKAKPFVETDDVKLVEIESKLLTEFYGTPTKMRAAVVLPESYSGNPRKKYPVVYEIPGFGGDHHAAFGVARRKGTNVAGTDMLYVMLDPKCRLGHHVFADSANNGPCGKALVEELIPAIEREYHAVGAPWGRFLTGHSSGGWSSLWLQVTYPDFFGGVWATSPDPVDFRDFQRIDLTKAGANMFVDADGKDRPLARQNHKPVLFYKPFSDMEVVMGHGGQLGSFEAVFSPRGKDGKPRQLWDRKTGAVDPEVARAWEKYDIRLQLERNWKTLGPKLAGKIHVYTGGEDTFYLEGAVALLKESQEKLGSDAVIEIVPDKDHGNLLNKKMRDRIAQEMADQYERLQSQANRPSSSK